MDSKKKGGLNKTLKGSAGKAPRGASGPMYKTEGSEDSKSLSPRNKRPNPPNRY